MASLLKQISSVNDRYNILESCQKLLKKNKIIQGLVAIFGTIIARRLYYVIYRKWNKLPPGPIGYPFLGCFINFATDPLFPLKMSQKYGGIVSIPFIVSHMFILSDPKLVKRLLTQKEYLNRRDVMTLRHDSWKSVYTVNTNTDHQTYPLFLESGQSWVKRRKHLTSVLFRTMNNKFVSNVLLQSFESEVVPFLTNLENENKAWYSRDMTQFLAFNALYHTLFGKQVDRNSNIYKELMFDLDSTFRMTPLDIILGSKSLFFRWIKYLPIAQKVSNVRNRRNKNIKSLVEMRLNDKKYNDDGIETYVDHMQQLVDEGEIKYDEFIADLYFLFIAGTDTTSSTLDFGIALAAKYGEIQDIVRKELLNVMKNGSFDLKIVHSCPLFRAFVYEVLRISSVAYLGVQHCVNEDKYIIYNGKEYKIPKQIFLLTDMNYIHHYNSNDNNSTWNKSIDGDKIVLENWLSDDGRFIKNESFVGFGVGRRDCAGRQLAMKEVQYILGYLLMKYEFTLENPESVGNLCQRKKGTFATVFLSPPVGVKIQKLSLC